MKPELARAHNPQLVTKALIENVTKSLNEVNFMGFEARINKLILTLLENPVKQMHKQE